MASSKPFEVLAVGPWLKGEVRVEWTASTRHIQENVEAAINSTWLEIKQRLGEHLFDGRIARFESMIATPRQPTLRVSATSYKPFLGTNLLGQPLLDRFGKSVAANPVGVSTLLISADEKILLGRRNGNVAYYPHRLHPFSGSMDIRDDGTPPDSFADALRELQEEVGLREDEITSLICTGLVEDKTIRHPELLFAARTTRLASEVIATMDREEHAEVIAIEAGRESIERLLAEEHETLTPVCVAAISLANTGRALLK